LSASIEILPTDWSDLWPHHSRGALLLVAPDADLHALAQAMAEDDVARIERALAARELARVPEPVATQWMENPPTFEVAIVQPWVLARLSGAAAAP
jgi:hypothetical protein